MSTDKQLNADLDAHFVGLSSGLKCLRGVRSVYDEQIAFDFNPLQLFYINENIVSDMLAYFLNPKASHGQKHTFLRIFLQRLEAQKALELLDQGVDINVTTQYYTQQRRPIDIVVIFGNNNFILGIENKVFGAIDQPAQIQDYISDISATSGGAFLMLYLSPYGAGPTTKSITPKNLQDCGERFKVITFSQANDNNPCAVIPMLKAFADAARADNVRSFIKLVIKYLGNHFMGDKTMDDEKCVLDYLVSHPDFFAHVPALQSGYAKISDDIRKAFYALLKQQLGTTDRQITFDSDWPRNKVAGLRYQRTVLPYPIDIELDDYKDLGVPLNNESNHPNSLQANNISIDALAKFTSTMKATYQNLNTNPWWLGGYVSLPIIDLGNHELLVSVMNERNTSIGSSKILADKAHSLANFFLAFVNNVESAWLGAGLPTTVKSGK
jgi:hypothetical protein